MRPVPLSALPLLAPALLVGCGAASYANEADDQVYGILETVSARVTGDRKTFSIDRKENTLRERLLADGGEAFLPLMTALDVAAENSREYARQKESLYMAALRLTAVAHDFNVLWGAGGAADVSGVGDDEADVSLADDLSASVNTVHGTRIVAGFINTFMRSVVHGGGWDPTSLLDLSITQPLLQGAGMNVRREALTQSERDVVYAVRDFERFRSEFIVDVISEYLGVVQQYQNLDNVQANFESVRQSREQIEALFDAGERSIIDVDRARQDELTAENRVVDAQNSLQSRLDSFKLTLGLPTDATIRLDEGALAQIEARGVDEVSIDEHEAIELALDRRYSHRTARDEVEDASRRVVVAENTLQSQLDFAAVIRVPSKPDEPLQFDWSQVQWAAGFDLELALNKLIERNAYRSSLINLNDRMRNRDQSEDSIKFQVRNSLRNILTTIENYKIQSNALTIAEQRVDSTRELYLADEAAALDVLDAQNSLLEAQLRLTTAIVDYSIARLGLLLDLEAVPVEPKGLRLDLALPLPTATAPPD